MAEITEIYQLNKSRMRAHYWRKDEKGNWVQTKLLPADPTSQQLYFSKGFRARNPDEVRIDEPQLVCPVCKMPAETVVALKAHLNEHVTIPPESEPKDEAEPVLTGTSDKRKKNEEEKTE